MPKTDSKFTWPGGPRSLGRGEKLSLVVDQLGVIDGLLDTARMTTLLLRKKLGTALVGMSRRLEQDVCELIAEHSDEPIEDVRGFHLNMIRGGSVADFIDGLFAILKEQAVALEMQGQLLTGEVAELEKTTSQTPS